jgi:hypothetical protein
MWNNLWGYVLRGPLHQWTLCRRPIRTWPRSGFGSWSQLSGPIAAVASVPWRSSDDIPGSDSDIWACKENEQLIGYISFYILQYIYMYRTRYNPLSSPDSIRYVMLPPPTAQRYLQVGRGCPGPSGFQRTQLGDSEVHRTALADPSPYLAGQGVRGGQGAAMWQEISWDNVDMTCGWLRMHV